MKINWNDPVLLSVFVGSVVFILTMIVLYLKRSGAIVNIDKKNHPYINRCKLFVLSLVIGLTASLSVFIIVVKGNTNPPRVSMRFSESY